ncbi:tyrosine--tRNA ligase [Candidatus Nomurabacteria bacterium RIFCSPLOWO2_01_FULL_36_10b]|uniref:Tyrosine--tRNA ligase n=1 Tax=Candidatus Nomurabacteria bacterium RIFCSPLOWO2_01_FULL_36_10b TaxID=1801766 RepID=A0A1F6WP89_9BACT|nr:MAG: tyrosine--tRNA ligase [Candidatus Nomurabacteria bacterium RIFCSPLOWO2_01_FULL_36_10b]
MKKKINTDTQKIEELLTRGVEEALDLNHIRQTLMSGKQLRVKLGIDPTSPNLHLGRSVPLLKLRDFQELGHHIVFIVGDFTGVIGDTSDKDAERPMLNEKTIEQNIKTYKKQIAKILDVNKIEFCKNSSWLGKLKFNEIGKMANAFSVNGFIQRDNIRKRLEEGKRVSLREVLYPLMQGYDSVVVRSDVEIGGTDQRFNILAGRTLQTYHGQEPQDIIMGPIVAGLDGRKMSSSWGNTINFMDAPVDMYGKVMSLHDNLIITYLNLMTRVPISDIQKFKQQLATGENPKNIKMHLAREIVTMYHSAKEAKQAEETWQSTFSKGLIPENAKTITVNIKEPMIDILIREGFVKSKTEFRQLIQDGAITFHGSIEERKIIDPNSLVGEDGALRIGKKRFLKIKIQKKK